MKRILTTCFILGLLAGLLFSATAHAATHHRNPIRLSGLLSCFDIQQFPQTYAIEDTNNLFFVGVNGTAEFSCTTKWAVTFVPLYQDNGWNVGFDNVLRFPLGSGYYSQGADKVFTPPNQPTSFTGLWDNGDGLRASRPVCAETWRVRERFTNGQGTTIGTYYSPTQTPTC